MPNRLMTWKEQALIAVLAGALGLGAISLYFAGSGDKTGIAPPEAGVAVTDAAPAIRVQPQAPTTPAPVPVAAAAQTPAAEIVVEVKGAVRTPNVYRLPEGSRVDDLLKEAGGPMAEADLSGINRAARLIDATTLVVPYRAHGAPGAYHALTENPAAYTVTGQGTGPAGTGDMAVQGGYTASAGASSGMVNINTASQAELETLPRVGPVTARKIIEYRNTTPFTRVEDLMNISGIGEKTLEGLRPHVTVR